MHVQARLTCTVSRRGATVAAQFAVLESLLTMRFSNVPLKLSQPDVWETDEGGITRTPKYNTAYLALSIFDNDTRIDLWPVTNRLHVLGLLCNDVPLDRSFSSVSLQRTYKHLVVYRSCWTRIYNFCNSGVTLTQLTLRVYIYSGNSGVLLRSAVPFCFSFVLPFWTYIKQ